MTRINLLPWRETLKKEREIRFGIITGINLAIALLVVLAVHLHMENAISYQEQRNGYLKIQIGEAENLIKEIEALDQKKQNLIARMNVIQELEESRPQVVHLFDEIVKQVPNGVYFTSMRQKDNQITLEGIAQSDARVSSLMSNIETSQWITNPKIISIVAKEEGNKNAQIKKSSSTFKLEVTQTSPTKKKKEQEEKAQKDKPKKATS
jgi:type IV pilus assembly protein PilN